nr:hypothetical protein [Porphyromonas canoris]
METSVPDSVHLTNRQPSFGVATTVTCVFSSNFPAPDTVPPSLGLAERVTVYCLGGIFSNCATRVRLFVIGNE